MLTVGPYTSGPCHVMYLGFGDACALSGWKRWRSQPLTYLSANFVFDKRILPGFAGFKSTGLSILPKRFASLSTFRSAHKLYVNGNEASNISVEGGIFRRNEALEAGGALAVWGVPGLVTITGGTFERNKAT